MEDSLALLEAARFPQRETVTCPVGGKTSGDFREISTPPPWNLNIESQSIQQAGRDQASL
jgi:hypothetical protein